MISSVCHTSNGNCCVTLLSCWCPHVLLHFIITVTEDILCLPSLTGCDIPRASWKERIQHTQRRDHSSGNSVLCYHLSFKNDTFQYCIAVVLSCISAAFSIRGKPSVSCVPVVWCVLRPYLIPTKLWWRCSWWPTTLAICPSITWRSSATASSWCQSRRVLRGKARSLQEAEC